METGSPQREAPSTSAAAAARTLGRGGVLVFPTDTVYGIGCVPRPAGVARIYRLKGRSGRKPLILLASSTAQVRRAGALFGPASSRLARRHWPGAVTLVLPVRDPRLAAAVRARSGVGFRVPRHAWLLRVLRRLGSAIASTSANVSGGANARALSEVPRALLRGADLAVDGGRSRARRPSTVVDCTSDPPRVLRKGSVRIALRKRASPGPQRVDSAPR